MHTSCGRTALFLSATTIFEQMQNAGITWKIYVHPGANGCTTPTCLYQLSYIQNFTYGQTILSQFPQNILPDSQYLTDAQNGTLPQVAMIEPPSEVGLMNTQPTMTPIRHVAVCKPGLTTSPPW